MAHSRDTQLEVYDVHGEAGSSSRVRGHGAVIRARGLLAAADPASEDDSDTADIIAHPGATVTAPAAAADANNRTSPAAPAASPAAPAARVASRQERTVWTAEESQILMSACRDFITGAKRRYDARDLGLRDMRGLHRFTGQQIYDKAKYLRRRYGK